MIPETRDQYNLLSDPMMREWDANNLEWNELYGTWAGILSYKIIPRTASPEDIENFDRLGIQLKAMNNRNKELTRKLSAKYIKKANDGESATEHQPEVQ